MAFIWLVRVAFLYELSVCGTMKCGSYMQLSLEFKETMSLTLSLRTETALFIGI